MARTSTYGRAPFDLGPLVGLFLFLFLAVSLVALVARFAWPSRGAARAGLKTGTGRATGTARAAPAPAVPLPEIDPSTPVARLLPAPPKAARAPVYLGRDL